MELSGLFFSIFTTIAVAAVLLTMVSVVLQLAYRIVCRRHLRYLKAYTLLAVLFLIGFGLRFIFEAMAVSLDTSYQSALVFVEPALIFLIGATLYGYWMNAKTGKPIGFLKGLLVQLLFYAMTSGIGCLVAIPFLLFMR